MVVFFYDPQQNHMLHSSEQKYLKSIPALRSTQKIFLEIQKLHGPEIFIQIYTLYGLWENISYGIQRPRALHTPSNRILHISSRQMNFLHTSVVFFFGSTFNVLFKYEFNYWRQFATPLNILFCFYIFQQTCQAGNPKQKQHHHHSTQVNRVRFPEQFEQWLVSEAFCSLLVIYVITSYINFIKVAPASQRIAWHRIGWMRRLLLFLLLLLFVCALSSHVLRICLQMVQCVRWKTGFHERQGCWLFLGLGF